MFGRAALKARLTLENARRVEAERKYESIYRQLNNTQAGLSTAQMQLNAHNSKEGKRAAKRHTERLHVEANITAALDLAVADDALEAATTLAHILKTFKEIQ